MVFNFYIILLYFIIIEQCFYTNEISRKVYGLKRLTYV